MSADARPGALRVLLAPGRPAWTDAVARTMGPCVIVDPLGRALRPVELGLRLWGRRSTRDRLTADALRRQLAGAIVRLPPGTREVLAPSLAALEAFDAARQVGARCTLLADLPDLAQLHADLDDAAERWPDCRFLRNHRAAPALVQRQAEEWARADRVVVRSRFAAVHPWATRFPSAEATLHRATSGPPVARLAGLASGRSGAAEALLALEQLPDLRLSVRLGDGAWPAALRHHPRVVGDVPCHVLWAPSWVETGDAEVDGAARAGIPIVATERGAGWTAATLIPRGDVDALVAATAAILRGEAAPLPPSAPERAAVVRGSGGAAATFVLPAA